jgi:hypothetical protein
VWKFEDVPDELRSVSSTIKYDYDNAMKIFEDCYNRKYLIGYERKIGVVLADAEVTKELLELVKKSEDK